MESLLPPSSSQWANHIVGRWWEVFWEPTATSSSSEEMVVAVDDENEIRKGRATTSSSLRYHPPHDLPLDGSALSLDRHHSPSHTEPRQDETPSPQLQQINVLFTTPALGVALVLVNDTQIIIKGINNDNNNIGVSSSSSSSALACLRPNDILVGINGTRLDDLLGRKVEGQEALQEIIQLLTTQRRPMLVMFERWVHNPAASATVLLSSNCGMSDVKQNSDKATITATLASNCNATANDDNDEEDLNNDNNSTSETDDDIDWYDAKVLSYNDKTGKHTVYFLGSETSVTYEMVLSMKIVRPSVRAWTKRTLALLNLNAKEKIITGNIENYLPSSTEFLNDTIIQQSERTKFTNGITNSTNKVLAQVLEYKILLAKQLYLATNLSPPNVEEEDDEDNIDDDDTGPGPSADSNYIKHLCSCIKESEKTCTWLLGESIILDVMNDTEGIGATTTRENILSFLVNGARFLNSILSFDPNCKVGAVIHRGTSRRSTKKQRVGISHAIDDKAFEGLLSKALLFNESLGTTLNQLFEKSSSTVVISHVWIAITLSNILSTLFHDFWEPLICWIRKSDAMINVTSSGQLFSLDDIEWHIQQTKTKETNLASIDVSVWITKLITKLNQALSFEMEVWNVIRTCTQPVVVAGLTPGEDNDECLLNLYRFKEYVTNDPIMRNINPLGKCGNGSGSIVPSTILTRGTIDDAITVRRWILDFNHAKVVRERIGFVKGIIERYSILPQLPTPPPLARIVTHPSAILAASMKDSITMLSSHCYSYNHIIGSAADKLRGNEISTKEGLSVALAELTRLPVLSIVEEKLHLREELIEWNREAQQLMDMSSKCKVSFGQVDDLNQQLSLILTAKSDKRTKVCQLLKNDRPVEEEIKNFAVFDERVICAITGAWVRDQYTRASEWKSKYCSIMTILRSHGYGNVDNIDIGKKSQDESVAIDRITALLIDHDTLAISFQDECNNLESVTRKVTDWSNTIQQILLSDTLTLDERREQLTNASHFRPRGVLVDPSVDLIDIWIGVFAWRMQLKSGVRSMLDSFGSSQIDCSNYGALKKLVISTIGPLMIDDLIFPEEFASNPFSTHLRREIFHSIHENTSTQSNTRRKIIESGIYGKHVLDLIFSADADKNLGSCISLTRRVVWIMMLQRFIIHLDSNDFVGGISDAKQLLSLSHGFHVTNSFLGSKADENRLLLLIDNAESFERQSSELIAQCSALLQTNCYSKKEELLMIQQHFFNILSCRKEPETALAMKLLQDKTLGDRISSTIKELTWLQQTFAYKILYHCADSQHSELCDRIHIDNLYDLCSTIPSRLSEECSENEIVRMSALVKNLKDRAEAWRSKVFHILPNLSDNSYFGDDIVKLETLINLTEDEILWTVNMPELELLQNSANVACTIQTRLENDLFLYEYVGATDVSQARLPNRTSLIQSRGDFILHRFTGSEMYEEIRRTLLPIHEMAAQLPVRTVEKATLEWMISIINWIESIHPEDDFRHQLVIKIEHALEVLEQGHMIFYSLPDEVLAYLERAKIGFLVLPQSFIVFDIRDGVCTLGMGLLRWAAIIYDCLKSDVQKIVKWRLSASYAIESFLKVYSEGVGGTLTTFSDATMFRDIVDRLIHESSNLIITDNKLIYSLTSLSKRMKMNLSFQKSIDDERSAMELKQILADKVQFTNPQNIVNNRYDLLDSIMGRLAIMPFEAVDIDDNSNLFAGESSVRDKSRFFLETSLWTGLETLGFDLKETDARDFSSIIAWRLEEIVHEVYNTDNSSDASEYRNKIRDLRFNLMNPKNPMLCARVLAGEMTLHDLVSASTEYLASNELKLMRRKVKEESIKNVVLAADQEKKEHYISNELAAKIRIESTTMTRFSPEGGISASLRDEDMDALLTKYQSASSPEPDLSLRLATKETTHILLPAPPMRVKKKHVHVGSAFESRFDQFDPPPPLQIDSLTSKSPIRHVLSQSQTDLFQICISKLKISFTTKLTADPNCQLEFDHLLPSILVEKGRLSVDEFNKFINAKSKGGKWNIVCMKLSSIEGESNSKLYKRYYKEYESLGRLAMFQVSDSTKIFLITPKFHRMVKCLDNVDHLSKSSTYAVVLTKESKAQKPIDDDTQIDDDMF